MIGKQNSIILNESAKRRPSMLFVQVLTKRFVDTSNPSLVDISKIIFCQQIIEEDPVSIKQPYKPPSSDCERFSKEYQFEELMDDNSLSNVKQARSKVLRSSELSTLNFPSSSPRLRSHCWLVLVVVTSLGLSRKVLQ